MASLKASVHCFGKLPIAADFIHHKLESEEARAFSEWIQKGQTLVEGVTRGRTPPGTAAPQPPRRYRLSFDGGQGRKIVLGLLRESHDRGKLRKFPFALYATVEGAALRERPALIPLLARGIWEALEADLDALPEGGTVDALVKRLDSLSLEVPDPAGHGAAELDHLLSGMKAGAFWSLALPGAGKDRRQWVFDVLVRALSPLRKAKPQDLPVQFKLPIGGDPEQALAGAAFWIELLSAQFRNPRQAPNIFLDAAPGQGAPRSMQIFFSRPDEKNFGSLMARTYETEYVDDLTAAGPAAARPALAEPLRRLVENDAMSLLELTRSPWL